jgi:hypothetical protein
MGRAPNYEYMLSKALVKMGKHPEEEWSEGCAGAVAASWSIRRTSDCVADSFID